MLSGWSGKILRVDLSRRKYSTEATDPYLDFVGGRGINVKIMFDEVGPEVAPYDPENRIVFGPGVLTGTPAPTASRMKITTMGPYGLIGSSGLGESIGAEIRHAGYDNIIIQGKADKPAYLYIHNDSVDFKDASGVWGKDTAASQQIIRQEIGDPDVQSLVIGTAGENLVAFSSVRTGVFTTAGRGGMGAIMGSKNLKAIAVRGERGIQLASAAEFLKTAYDLRKKLSEFPDFQAPIEKIERRVREINLRATKEGVPAFGNWEEVDWDEIDAKNFVYGVQEYYQKYQIARIGCFACPISRYRVCNDPDGGIGTSKCCISIPMFTFRVWNRSFQVMEAACHLCDSYGLDTISTANIIAFLMELYHRGIITEKDTDGVSMKRGSKEAIIATIHKIAKQEGFGKLFRDGLLSGAKNIGRGAESYAMTVKGLELGLREFRGRKGVALATAVSTRLAEGEYPLQEQNWGVAKEHPEAVHPAAYENKAALVFESAKKYIVTDMLGMCRNVFLRAFTQDLTIPVKLLALATGVNYTLDSLLAAAEKVHLLERAFDVTRGVRRKDDTLPRRMFETAVPGGPFKGQKLEKEKFEKMLSEYYMISGWDEDGVPTEETFIKSGLASEYETFKKRLRLRNAPP